MTQRNDTARMKAILTLTGALAFLLFSAAAPPFTGYTAEQLPQAIGRPPVQPAGYAFGIWGVIYPWLVISAGFGLFRRADDMAWDRARWPLIIALGLGAGWLWVAVTDAILATVMIFAMLAAALFALARAPQGAGGADLWLARAPIGLFAGWLTAASFVSMGLVLGGFGLLPSGRAAAFVAIPLAAVVAATVILRLRGGGAYAFAVAWGLVGIAVANFGTEGDIAVLALAGALLLAALWWRVR